MRSGGKGREPRLGGCESAPEKGPGEGSREKCSSAGLEAEDKAWFSFEELLLLLEPIPSRGVSSGHGSSACTGNFLLPSLIPDAPNKSSLQRTDWGRDF